MSDPHTKCVLKGWAEDAIRDFNQIEWQKDHPPKGFNPVAAEHNLLCKLVQAAKAYVEETGVGE